VQPALPAFLPPLPAGAKADRLAFAQWLVSRDHPLTARVWVNRTWERFFGTGLVKTSENLGSQAEYPSHPELLDWLAAEFMESGWDMKRFIRLIVGSATYRQAATTTTEKLAKDPANRLLARAPRIRLPGEIVRDSALAAAGLLVPTVGGPSARVCGTRRASTATSAATNQTPDPAAIVARCTRSGSGRPRRRPCCSSTLPAARPAS
jgi:hypothetical protein